MPDTHTIGQPVRLADVLTATYLGMFLLGSAATSYGPILVYLEAETHLPLSRLGALLVLHWAGFFGATLSANWLARRLEMRRGIASAALGLGVSTLAMVGLPFPFSLAAAAILGYSAGVLEILLNRLTELLAAREPAAALSRLHALWGLGAIVIPLVVVGAAQTPLGWRGAGLVVAAIAALSVAATLRWPEFAVAHGSGRRYPWRPAVLFALVFVFYVGVEGALGSWAATFIARLGQGPVMGALATSLFFLTFTIGRYFFAAGIERVGYIRSVQISCAVGGLSLLLTWLPGWELLGFALAGLAYSIVFPTMIAWMARRYPQWRAQLTGLGVASGGVGGLLLPYVIGLGVDALGARALSPMLVAVAAVLFVLTIIIR